MWYENWLWHHFHWFHFSNNERKINNLWTTDRVRSLIVLFLIFFSSSIFWYFIICSDIEFMCSLKSLINRYQIWCWFRFPHIEISNCIFLRLLYIYSAASIDAHFEFGSERNVRLVTVPPQLHHFCNHSQFGHSLPIVQLIDTKYTNMKVYG